MTNSSRKRGRPELTNSEKRSVITQFRCTPDERKLMESAAETNGQGLSDWLREQALQAAQYTGNDPAADQRTLFYRTLGEGLSYWHWLEVHLFHIIHLFLHPAKLEMVSSMYFSVTSFEAKLNMLRNAGRQYWKGDTKKIKEWNKFLEKLGDHSRFRNRLAHDMVVYDTDKREVILHFGSYNQAFINQSRQPLKLKDLETFKNNVNNDTVKLASIYAELAEHLGLDE